MRMKSEVTQVSSSVLVLDRVSYRYSTYGWLTRWITRWGQGRQERALWGESRQSDPRSAKLISKRGFGGVYDLSLNLMSGQVVGITGPNGAGKSTLFKLLCGDLYPQRGALYLDGVEITRAPRWRRARLGLGYLSQRGALVGDLSVALNLKLGAEAGLLWGFSSPHNQAEDETLTPCVFNYEASDRDTLIRALEQFDASRLIDQRVDTLSGGERRRVELTRLSLMSPRVALLDEPFAALDAEGIAMTLTLIKHMRAQGVLVLLTDHQSDYIGEVCDHVCRLSSGRLTDRAGDIIEGVER